MKVALFGSFAKGEEGKRSVDILIKHQKGSGKSLLDLIKLQFELEDKLGRKVDLLTYNGINPLLKDSIMSYQKVIYEKKKGS